MKSVFPLFRFTVLFAVLFSLISPNPVFAAKKNYEYYVVGNSSNVNTTTQTGTVLIGGGTDVDAAFQWMINKSGRGDFVVIRATGTDAYKSYIYGLGTIAVTSSQSGGSIY